MNNPFWLCYIGQSQNDAGHRGCVQCGVRIRLNPTSTQQARELLEFEFKHPANWNEQINEPIWDAAQIERIKTLVQWIANPTGPEYINLAGLIQELAAAAVEFLRRNGSDPELWVHDALDMAYVRNYPLAVYCAAKVGKAVFTCCETQQVTNVFETPSCSNCGRLMTNQTALALSPVWKDVEERIMLADSLGLRIQVCSNDHLWVVPEKSEHICWDCQEKNPPFETLEGHYAYMREVARIAVEDGNIDSAGYFAAKGRARLVSCFNDNCPQPHNCQVQEKASTTPLLCRGCKSPMAANPDAWRQVQRDYAQKIADSGNITEAATFAVRCGSMVVVCSNGYCPSVAENTKVAMVITPGEQIPECPFCHGILW